MLKKFDGGGSNTVFDIVTGEESWIYLMNLKPKDNLLSGCFLYRIGQLRCKKEEDNFLIHWLERSFRKDGRSVTVNWYVNSCLPVLSGKSSSTAASKQDRPSARQRF